jgi:uncharacterized protein (DUF983 family)
MSNANIMQDMFMIFTIWGHVVVVVVVVIIVTVNLYKRETSFSIAVHNL